LLKNILGGISGGQIDGIIINAGDYEESKLMVDRIHRLNKPFKTGNSFLVFIGIGDLKIDLNCSFDGPDEYKALKALNIQKI
jgi:hypothetical protein